MRRLPAIVFGVLATVSVGAFFLTQHLKTKVPLVEGQPRPDPSAIDPIAGGVCPDNEGVPVSFRRTRLSFYLAHPDTVIVNVVNSFGEQVATVSAGRPMRAGVRSLFVWNGEASGGGVVPAGLYYFEIHLLHEGRGIELTDAPVRVVTSPPSPRILSVAAVSSAAVQAGATTTTSSATTSTSSAGGSTTSAGASTTASATGTSAAASTTSAGTHVAAGPAVIAPPATELAIRFRRGDYRGASIDVFRASVAGQLTEVKRFGVGPGASTAVWDGTIGSRPAPAGTYLVGMTVVGAACDTGRYPLSDTPAPGSTPGAGVTVRYLAVTPPLTAQPSGSLASFTVDAAGRSYAWRLRASATGRLVFHGTEPAGHTLLHVRVPRTGAGLYQLVVAAGARTVTVPLVAAADNARAPVLVVLPAVTWQGANPVDDDGNGLPDTLTAGDAINLERPFAGGLPSGFSDQAELIAYLAASGDSVQLTTDLSLALRQGPTLDGHTGVILDGDVGWLPSDLVARLRAYVQAGGRLVSIGAGSLAARAPVEQTQAGAVAGPPAPLSPDPFGARHGASGAVGGELITPFSDPLGIFTGVPALSGFASYQTISPPSGVAASLAGIAPSVPSVTGFRLGSGTVVEVGLSGFGAATGANVGAQELMGRLWQLLDH